MPSISRTDPRTPAAQIADSLRADIDGDRLSTGTTLPSERELASAWGVSTTTIARAIAQLRQEGLIDSRPGAPRRIRSHPPRRQLHRTHTRPEDHGQLRIESADAVTAQALTIEPGSDVLSHETVIPHEQMTSTRVPREFVHGTRLDQSTSGTAGIPAALAERGHPVARIVDAVHTRMPTPHERAALELDPGDPVIVVTRTAYDRDGRPLLIATATYVGLRVELLYEVQVGAGPAPSGRARGE